MAYQAFMIIHNGLKGLYAYSWWLRRPLWFFIMA